jgi:hypothetical protein
VDPDLQVFASILVAWIRIQEGKNDPQKVKSKEFFFRMFSFEGQRLFLQLGHSS